MRFNFAKFILVSTRITYQATRDAVMCIHIRYTAKQARPPRQEQAWSPHACCSACGSAFPLSFRKSSDKIFLRTKVSFYQVFRASVHKDYEYFETFEYFAVHPAWDTRDSFFEEYAREIRRLTHSRLPNSTLPMCPTLSRRVNKANANTYTQPRKDTPSMLFSNQIIKTPGRGHRIASRSGLGEQFMKG